MFLISFFFSFLLWYHNIVILQPSDLKFCDANHYGLLQRSVILLLFLLLLFSNIIILCKATPIIMKAFFWISQSEYQDQ